MGLKEDISRFDDEGGAMRPVAPVKKEKKVNEGVALVYALMALSGAAVALLLTWVF